MAFDSEGLLTYVASALRDLDLFFAVDIERPGQPRGEGPNATVHCESIRVVGTTMTHPIEVHRLHVTIWRAMNTTGGQNQEVEAQSVTGQVMDYFYGHFTINGRSRAVDVAGMYGDVLEMTTDTRDLENGARYFVADITVPVIVDGATAYAA